MKQSKKAGRLKALSLFSIVLAVAIAGTTSMASADGIPERPNQFYGTITLNGNDAPAGTIVRAYVGDAYVGDELRGSVVAATSGSYGFDMNYLSVQGTDGEVITFTVAGAPAAETIMWDADSGPRELDLTAEDHVGPVVSNPSANPESVVANGVQLSRLNVTATDNGDIYRVTVNLSTVGGPDAKRMYCIGGDTYSATTTVDEGIPNGTYDLRVTASDFGGNYDESAVDVTLIVGDISDDWRNKWMGPDSEEGSTLTLNELQEAAWYWLTGTPLEEEYGYHVLTIEDIQELITAWSSGEGA